MLCLGCTHNRHRRFDVGGRSVCQKFWEALGQVRLTFSFSGELVATIFADRPGLFHIHTHMALRRQGTARSFISVFAPTSLHLLYRGKERSGSIRLQTYEFVGDGGRLDTDRDLFLCGAHSLEGVLVWG